jgi:AmiR/NasT family two-component response regulator
VIDQALGILMAQQRCSADEAFALLRTHSQNNNRKLRDVAADLITRVTGQPPVLGRGFERGHPAAD